MDIKLKKGMVQIIGVGSVFDPVAAFKFSTRGAKFILPDVNMAGFEETMKLLGFVLNFMMDEQLGNGGYGK